MSLERGISDDLRSGFLLTHTSSTSDGQGNYEQGSFGIILEAPDYDGEHDATAEVFMAQGIVRFFEIATEGTFKMVMIFAKALWDYKP